MDAGPVRVGLPLRDDTLKVMLLDGSHERLAAPLDRQRLGDEMIGAPPQEAPQPRLALHKRQRAQILAVEPQHIEGDDAHRVSAAKHLDEDRAPGLVGADDLAVEDGVLDAQTLRQSCGERIELTEAIPGL